MTNPFTFILSFQRRLESIVVSQSLDSSLRSNDKFAYRILVVMILLAFISLYFTLFLPYDGEEGQYTLSAVEMAYHHYYWQPLSYGTHYWRPPLYNWLIIAVMQLTGIAQVLVAARAVTACASLLTGLLLWFFSKRLFDNKLFAVLTVAVFFSGDFLFRRSWIAYADPLFTLAIFTAISFMWLAYREQRAAFWIPVPLALLAGLLIKALTVYVFYGTALMVVWLSSTDRYYLFKPASLLAHLTALFLPALWFCWAPDANWHSMFGDIAHSTTDTSHHLLGYLKKLLTTPFEMVFRFAPIDLLVLYSLYQQKKNPQKLPALPALKAPVKPLLWIIVLSALPYWLAPSFLPVRYFLPLMPLIAIVFAYFIWRGGQRIMAIAMLVLLLELGLKYVSSFIGLPWCEHMTYAHADIAADVVKRTQNTALYASNMDNRTGLSIGALIDAKRWPQAPLIPPPMAFQQGCVVTPVENSQWGNLQKTYPAGNHMTIYLYCRSL